MGILAIILIAGVFSYFLFSEQSSITDQQAVQIVQHQYVKNPKFAIALRDKGEYYIVASINDGEYPEPRLLVLKQIAGLWQEQPQSVELFCSVLECPSDAKKVELNGSPYVYFVTESYGTAQGSVDFNLFSPSEIHLYTISVFGGIGNINQLKPISTDVKNNKNVYDYLTQSIEKSSKITHISEQDLSIESPDNAVQKWQLDNEYIRSGMANNSAPIKFTYYSENLFNPWSGTTVTGAIENSYYRFVAYFKGVVIGLDKTTNKYFVVWVPSNTYEWPEDLTFIDSKTIHLNSANSGPSITIHLNTNTITTP